MRAQLCQKFTKRRSHIKDVITVMLLIYCSLFVRNMGKFTLVFEKFTPI